MRRSLRLLGAATAAAVTGTGVVALTGTTASAVTFTPTDLVVYRVGATGGTLSNAAAPVFLDTYASDTATGLPKATVAVPTTTTGQQHRLTATGLSRSEGQLSLSPDGTLVAFTGYDAASGATGPDTTYDDVNGVPVTITQSLTASSPTSVGRVVGLLDGAGSTDTSTSVTGAAVPHIVRAATTVDGTSLWLGGSDGGVLTAQRGDTTATSVLATPGFDADALQVASGQLLAGGANDGAAADRLGTVGAGLPTSGAAVTGFNGLPAGLLPGGFVALDLASPAGVDTVYAVNGAERGGGVDKYAFDSGSSTWAKQGFASLPGALAVTGKAVGSQVLLAATTKDALFTFGEADATSGFDHTEPTKIADAPTDTEFRGVAVAPTGDALSKLTVGITTPAVGAHVASNATTLAVSGTTSGLRGVSSVTVKVDSGTAEAQTLTEGGWNGTVTLPPSLATGTHTLTVTATDNGLTPATATATRTFTKDAPPAITIGAPTAGQHVSYLTGSLVVKGAASAARGVQSVTVQLDKTAPVAVPLSGTSWSRSITLSSLAVGSHTLTVKATEKTSGAVTAVTRAFVRDGVPSDSLGNGLWSFLNAKVHRSTGWTAFSYPPSPDRRGIRTLGTSSVTFLSYGRSLDLRFQRRADAGKVRITVDGKAVVLDLYGSTADITKAYRGLSAGKHRVTVQALHQRNTRSKNYYVTLELLRVYS
jgi:hypothetical protein